MTCEERLAALITRVSDLEARVTKLEQTVTVMWDRIVKDWWKIRGMEHGTPIPPIPDSPMIATPLPPRPVTDAGLDHM